MQEKSIPIKEKLPWFKFYPQDWLGNLKLKQCSLAARGLWMDLICIMIRSEKRGFLLINNHIPSIKTLSILLGIDTKAIRKNLQELTEKGVIKKTNDGIYYSSRIIRDVEAQRVSREYGKKGGNPTLNPTLNPILNPTLNPTLKARVKLESESESESDIICRDANLNTNINHSTTEENSKQGACDCVALKTKKITTVNNYTAGITQIIDYLNTRLSSKFSTKAKTTVRVLTARLKEGYVLEDFYFVIDNKFIAWGKDPKMSNFLRPETLFGEKFDGYLNEVSLIPKKAKDNINGITAD